MTTRRTRRATGLLLAPLLVGCGAVADSADATARLPHGTRRSAIRPTDGTGWMGNGYDAGAMIKSYDPPGGHLRVHYAVSGQSAVDPTDIDPMDGVPDFVNSVGTAAETTWESTIDTRGFRPPLDDSVYHDRPDYGGDGRFDIYLRQAGDGSDGYVVVEVCTDGTDGGAPDRCEGYFVMNPSFAGSQYKTELDGIQVLTSHELFHAVQDAYNNAQWRTFTEGTAVWNELQVFPRTADHDGTFTDYRGFISALFNEPERPIDQSMGNEPGGAYAYAAAAWFEYLSERFGPQLIRELWEGSQASPAGDSPQFLDVTDALLRDHYQTDLVAAFVEFTRWNLLTGARALPQPAGTPSGYQRAAEYPTVRLEPALTALGQRGTATVDGLSARYFPFMVPLTAPQRLRLHVSDPAAKPAVGTLYVIPPGSSTPMAPIAVPVPALDLDVQPGQQLLLVVSGTTRGPSSRNVSVYLDTDVAPPAASPMPMSCAMQTAPRPAAGPLFGLGSLLVLTLLWRRRRADQ